MAVTKITWENKTGIQNDASVARKNKVVDEDMNEIKQVVNNNADELTTAKDNIKNLQSGQGTANADITSLKNRLSTLETDNTKNKSEITNLKSDNQTNTSNISTMQGQISEIQKEQITQNTNIEKLQANDTNQDELISKLQEENKKLKNALINAETEGQSIHVEDASNLEGQLEVLGNVEQEVTENSPSPDYPSPVVCVGSNKNEFNNSNTYNGYITGTPGQKISYQSSTFSKTYKACCKLVKDKKYTLSFKKNNPANTSSKICVIADEDETILQTFNLNPAKETLIITSTQTGYLYLVVDVNATDIKIEEGTKSTSYSPYGQGSVGIKKQNKNLFDISKYPFTNKVAYSLTGKLNYWTGYCGIVEYFPVKEDTNYVFSNNLNKPITYGLMFYNKNKEFISGIVENTTKFVTPKNCKYIRFAIQSDTLPIWVQIEIGDTATEYVEHQQTDYILPIQQEMLSGDYFVKEPDGWKEVHNYSKKTFDGTENWIKSGSSTDDIFVATLNLGNAVDGYGYSNYFKYNQRVGIRYFTIYNNGVHIRLCVDGSQITTVDEFKSWLQEKYNAGNPIYVFYKLATPTKLPCTSEQSVVLEELNNLDLFKPVTNIVTAENIALLKLKYSLDVKTYVNNLLASQIAESEVQE